LIELQQKLFETTITGLISGDEIPDEDAVQDACAIALRAINLKVYREARYPTHPKSPKRDHVDIVATDGTQEDWLEIKLFKHIEGYQLNSGVDAGQGIPAKIGSDISKILRVPKPSGRFFLAVGYFTDFVTSNRASVIGSALGGQGTAVFHSVTPATSARNLNEVGLWLHSF
jgi:hypothetical protein